MKTAATLAAALLALVLAPWSASASAPSERWAVPVVQVHSTAPDASWHVNRAIAQWNKRGAVRLERVYAPCAGCVTITETSVPMEPLGYEWKGLSYAWATGGIIERCDILLDPNNAGKFAQGTSTHELGHCLGLPHTEAKWSIMNEGSVARIFHPRRRDYERLAALYAAR